ncbi:uncharacterized protein LOC143049080 isoform X2 [Mytilus galloprovincialis]|uniref:uncharacterized protein LOC143049080 isoform X2 n=1 Tax=Mytilus galloprovincialis TaxID=29158 RepID=UPI003F7BEFFA
MAGGNEIHGLSSNSVAQRNMQPSVPKSLFQKIIACFTQPNIICMPPDVKVIQEGGEILRISVNKGSERQSSMEVTIPSNCTLKQFTSTQDIERTENRENTENTENRILNHSSDLKLENQSCLTKKDRRKNPENTNFSIKSDIQFAKKSCSSNDSNFPMLKTTPQLNNTLSDKENDYSNEEYTEENKFPGKYHENPDKVIGKETRKRENEDATDSTPVIFAKPENSEVWNFMNEQTKFPNTCRVKQTGRHRLDQDVNWDELVQGITVPDINRTKDNQENGYFGGHFDRIKTVVIKQEHDLDKTSNTTKKETKKLCKLCQERELDTIFLPCGHLVLCNFCCAHASQTIKICPQCFNEIKHVNEAHF